MGWVCQNSISIGVLLVNFKDQRPMYYELWRQWSTSLPYLGFFLDTKNILFGERITLSPSSWNMPWLACFGSYQAVQSSGTWSATMAWQQWKAVCGCKACSGSERGQALPVWWGSSRGKGSGAWMLGSQQAACSITASPWNLGPEHTCDLLWEGPGNAWGNVKSPEILNCRRGENYRLTVYTVNKTSLNQSGVAQENQNLGDRWIDT